jgi:cellulose synthase/poly-beta-1,6-N-acetylglucosamine synthase-like glycosyltransferase
MDAEHKQFQSIHFTKHDQKEYLVDVLNNNQNLILRILLAIWMSSNLVFWLWWFQEHHIVNPQLFLLNTIGLFYTYMFPCYFFYFASRMKKSNPDIKIPYGWNVAMVVTKAPSEPFEVVQKTLDGMLAQTYPHDTWLADEDPQPETIKWCNQKGVQISTRRGVQEYNRAVWPRRKKCKEGNLSYFYDQYGYDNYDFVCQLDADHVPQKNYLENMLRPFVDESVGYVTAPSICSSNAKKSWTARARLYSEAALHGIQQAGLTNGFAPLCFGSHYAVRTKALSLIGGLGPELAEDHSTTLIMNAHGWKGVHAIDAVALGDGPETFFDAMIQEFQWSRSVTNILLMWTPKYFKMLPNNLKVQFVFSQLWYSIFSLLMLLGFLIPIIAIFSQTPLVRVPYPIFFLFNFLNIIVSLMIVRYLKKLNIFRPADAKIFSWEIAVFQVSRWPWTLMGVLSSFADSLSNKQFQFKVTPKNPRGFRPLPFKAILPYFIITIFFSSFGLVAEIDYDIRGYFYFLIIAAMMHLVTFWVIVLMHAYENLQRNR